MTPLWPYWKAKKVKYYFSNPSLKKTGPRKVTAAATLDVKKIEEDDSLISQVTRVNSCSHSSKNDSLGTVTNSTNSLSIDFRNDCQIWSGLKTPTKNEWGSNLVKSKIITKLPMDWLLNILGKSTLQATNGADYAKRSNQRGRANIGHTRTVGWKDNFSDTDYDYPQSSQNISRNNHYASSSVVQRHSRAAHLYRQGSYSTFRAGTKVRIRFWCVDPWSNVSL